jgi:hypothetical protein
MVAFQLGFSAPDGAISWKPTFGPQRRVDATKKHITGQFVRDLLVVVFAIHDGFFGVTGRC